MIYGRVETSVGHRFVISSHCTSDVASDPRNECIAMDKEDRDICSEQELMAMIQRRLLLFGGARWLSAGACFRSGGRWRLLQIGAFRAHCLKIIAEPFGPISVRVGITFVM